MKGRDTSHSRLIAGLLLASLALAGVLAWQAQVSMRYHRAAAEKVLRDYAMLAADELARRSGTELGYYGLYPLSTALSQASQGALPSPAALRASPDEGVRAASDLVRSTWRYEVATGHLEILGAKPDPAGEKWISEVIARAAARPASQQPRVYETSHGTPGGTLRSIVIPAPLGRPAFDGFEAEPAAFVPRFRKIVASGPLLPPSLAHGRVPNDALFLRIVDPSGRDAFRHGTKRDPYLGVERPFGDDYNGFLAGYVIHAAVDPAAARTLVIGGLPRSRLPFLLSLLALTAGLILTAALQLRRERALSEMRSHFVSRVSHELRTPLTQIRMFAETLLLNRVRSDEERRVSLEIIDRESRRLTHLVENVLRFSRGERGEDRVETAPRDLVPVVRQILLDFEPIVRGGTRVTSALPDTAVVSCDADAVRQILLNLLDNAVKYGPAGQEIRVELVVDGGRARLFVTDEGPGIPVSDRLRIWQRFYRLPRDRESAVAGTGIGLAVVQELARLHGGSAWVQGAGEAKEAKAERPDDRRGARFVVEFPEARPADGARS